MNGFASTPNVLSPRTRFTRTFCSTNARSRSRYAIRHDRSRQVPVMIRFPWQKSDENAPKITLNFEVGYAYRAHPEKGTGEDAFFVEGNCAGVFDGVSGAYATRGVDPRRYSQMLAALTQAGVKQLGSENAVKAAISAAEANTEIGASTACVVGMDEFGRMFGINLGDSGFRIIRGNRMIWRTREDQHFFNCPYQLGTDSEDTMQMGQNIQQKVRDGDWCILATDGLFDNVEDKEIAAVASQSEDPTTLAEELADIATKYSYDKKKESPFAKAAKKASVEWSGGKVDDITIVAIRIKDDASIRPVTLLSVLPDVEEVEEEEQVAAEK